MSPKALQSTVQRHESEFAEIRRLLQTASETIGDLGNKWGSYTEGLAAPSVRRVLEEEFGADTVVENYSITKKGEAQEFDLVGIANGRRNEVVLAEIKSRLPESELKKFEKKFADFFRFMPEHRGKTLKGLLVAVSMPKGMRERVASRGFYLMRGSDETFALVPAGKGFKPRTLKG